jgi:hypothetical protein
VYSGLALTTFSRTWARVQQLCAHHCFVVASGGSFSSSAAVLGRLILGGIAFGHLQ